MRSGPEALATSCRPGTKDQNPAQLEALAGVLKQRQQRLTVLGGRSLSRYLSGQTAGVKQGFIGQMVVEGIDNAERSAQRVFDLAGEPVVDGPVDKADADQQQQNGRQQGNRHKGQDQLKAQIRARQLLPSLVKEFDQIATDQKNEQDEQNDIEVDQQDEDDIAAQTVSIAELRQRTLKDGKQPYAKSGDQNQHAFPAPPAFGLLRLWGRGSGRRSCVHGSHLLDGRGVQNSRS